MVGTENIRSNLINIIQHINDDDALLNLFKQAVLLEKKEAKAHQKNKYVDFNEAIVEWDDENISFEDILKQQNYKPISYEEFQAKADEIEWEYSLDELLAALD
jgi:hypothetical protein